MTLTNASLSVKNKIQLFFHKLPQISLKNSNGTSMFLHDRFLSNKTLDLYTDTTKSKGFGGVYGSRWFYGSFPDDWKVMNMILEFYPIILVLEIWGSLWKNHVVHVVLVSETPLPATEKENRPIHFVFLLYELP
jgi:hypothetical protein